MTPKWQFLKAQPTSCLSDEGRVAKEKRGLRASVHATSPRCTGPAQAARAPNNPPTHTCGRRDAPAGPKRTKLPAAVRGYSGCSGCSGCSACHACHACRGCHEWPARYVRYAWHPHQASGAWRTCHARRACLAPKTRSLAVRLGRLQQELQNQHLQGRHRPVLLGWEREASRDLR